MDNEKNNTGSTNQDNVETVHLNNEVPAVHKSRKKPTLIALGIILGIALLAGGAFALFNSGEDASQLQNTTQQTNQTDAEPTNNFDSRLFTQINQEVSFINSNSEVEEFTTLEQDEFIADVFIKNNEPVGVFQKAVDNNLTLVGAVTSQERNVLFEYPTGTSPYYSEAIVSPNGDFVLYEQSTANGFLESIHSIDLSDGTTKKVYTATQLSQSQTPNKDNYMRQIGWLDSSTALYQQQSCRQCDGGSLPQLLTLNIESGKLTNVYDNSSANIAVAEFVLSPDNSKLFMLTSEEHPLGFEPTKNYNQAYHEINTQSWTENTIGTVEGGNVYYSGMNTTGETMYITIDTYSKTDDENAPYQSVEGNYAISKKELIKFNTANGTTSAFPIEVSGFNAASSAYRTVLQSNDSLAFSVEDYNSQDGSQKFSVYLLPLDGEENTIEFLGSQSSRAYAFDHILYAKNVQ